MDEIEVPHYFLCPISLQMMKDPVIVPSGITYDRHSIETWLYITNNPSCPVTKHPISTADSDSLTPNHTLRRLIQAWCTLHSNHGIQRIPTPKPPITKHQILKLISSPPPSSLLPSIRRLRSLAADSESNRRCIESAGAPLFLASAIANSISDDDDDSTCCHEALSTLHNLRLSNSALKTLTQTGEFIHTLTKVMERGTYESRAYAALILKSILEVADPTEISFLKHELFVEMVGILKDGTSSVQQSVMKAALGVLVAACPWGRNRVKAVEAGGVGALVEILMGSTERRVCEMALTAVDLLCGCAEGRAALIGHGGGMAVVSKKILRVSQVGSERGVRILLSVAKYSGSKAVLMEMAELGIVAKLCLVLQVETGNKTKEKAKQILKMHAAVWRNSNCIPFKLASSYPKPN